MSPIRKAFDPLLRSETCPAVDWPALASLGQALVVARLGGLIFALEPRGIECLDIPRCFAHALVRLLFRGESVKGVIADINARDGWLSVRDGLAKICNAAEAELAQREGPTRPPENATGKTKGKRVNEQMRKLMEDVPECLGWTVQQWADRIGCVASSIVPTETWQLIMAGRAVREADRLMRHENARPTDRRRIGRKKSTDK
jgi:hypothetical protein